MPKKSDYSELNGITLSVADFPNWKHSLIKWFARLLFIRKVKYVIVIHDMEEIDESTIVG